jgi:hypothetical protein
MFDQTLFRTPSQYRATKGTTLQSPNSVRVLRSDPEGVILQFRREKDYVQVWLPFEEAKRLAGWLSAACEAQ